MISVILNERNSSTIALENEYYNHGDCIDFAIRNMHYHYINPLKAGYQKCPPGHGRIWNKLEYYLVHYVVSGEGTLFSRGTEYHVKAGEAFLVCANEIFRYQASDTNPWDYIWIAFNGEITKEFDSLSVPVFEANKHIFEKVKESLAYSNTREVFLMSCISELYCNIFDKSEELNIISSVKNYIDANYMANIKISDIAASLHISHNHITRLFKEKTGKTPREYILRRKMKAAKSLLESGNNVNETAQLLGYADQSVFSKAFKKYYGYYPSKEK